MLAMHYPEHQVMPHTQPRQETGNAGHAGDAANPSLCRARASKKPGLVKKKDHLNPGAVSEDMARFLPQRRRSAAPPGTPPLRRVASAP